MNEGVKQHPKPIFIKVSKIKNRWLRRLAILGTIPIMTLFGWGEILLAYGILLLMTPFVMGMKAVELQINLWKGVARVWRLPSGTIDEINPLCAGGVRELERAGRPCPKCGSTETEPCLQQYPPNLNVNSSDRRNPFPH